MPRHVTATALTRIDMFANRQQTIRRLTELRLDHVCIFVQFFALSGLISVCARRHQTTAAARQLESRRRRPVMLPAD